jgi:hypothetical protein
MINNSQYIVPMEFLYLYYILLSTNMMPLRGALSIRPFRAEILVVITNIDNSINPNPLKGL